MGRSDRGLIEQAGQAAKFSVLYGAAYTVLNGITQSLGLAFQNTVEFENGLADLATITQRTRGENEKMANAFMDAGSAGALLPGESVSAGARALGLYDLVGADETTQQRIGSLSTRVSGQMAYISGQPVEQIQTQIAGVGRSFGIGPDDQERIADITAFIGKRSGRNAGDILSSVAQIGTLGADAGFDAEEVAAMVARITSSTSQSPQAVAGFLSQILSKADDPRVKERLAQIGVETEGTTLAEQIRELGAMDLPQDQLNPIIQTFGRGRSGQAMSIILAQQGEIQGLAEGARGSDGEFADTFNRQINTIGGQLRQLFDHFVKLLVDIANTGAFDTLVLLVQALDLTVQALDGIVGAFNELPRGLRTTAFAIAELVAVLAILTRVAAGTRAGAAAATVLESVGLGRFVGADARDGRGGRGATVRARSERLDRNVLGRGAALDAFDADLFPDGDDPNRRGGFAGRAGRAWGAASTRFARTGSGQLLTNLGMTAGGALGLTVGAAAVGAGVLGYGMYEGIQERNATEEALRSARRQAATAGSPEEFRAAAAAARAAGKAAQKEIDFNAGQVQDYLGVAAVNSLSAAGILPETGAVRDRRRADATAGRAEMNARGMEAADQAAHEASPSTYFNDLGSAEAVETSIKALGDKGYSAAQQIGFLNQAFDTLITKSTFGADAIAVIAQGQGAAFTQKAAQTATGSVFGDNGVASWLRTDATALDPAGSSSNWLVRNGQLGAFSNWQNGNGPGDVRRAKRLRMAADFIEENVNEDELQGQINEDIQRVLRDRGKDGASGPAALNQDDINEITKVTRGNLKDALGPALEMLPEEERKKYLDGVVATALNSQRAAMGDFGGKPPTPAALKVFLDAQTSLAQVAGKETALRTGDDVAGARDTVTGIRAARDEAARLLPTIEDPKEREEAARKLKANETALTQAEDELAQSLVRRAQILGQDRASRLSQFDVVGRSRNDVQTLGAQLALTRKADERLAIQAQIREAQQRIPFQQLDARNAMALGGLAAGNELGQLQTAVSTADQRLGLLDASGASGTQEYGNALATQKAARKAVADYFLDVARTVDALNSNAPEGGSLAIARNAARDAARRLSAARQTGDVRTVADAELAVRQANAAQRQALLDEANASINRFSMGSRSDDTKTRNNLLIAQNRLNDVRARGIKPGQKEYSDAQGELWAAQIGRQDFEDRRRIAQIQAQVTPGNSMEQASADRRAAEVQAARVRSLAATDPARVEAESRLRQTRFVERQRQMDLRSAQRAAAVAPDSQLGSAANAVGDARDQLALFEKGSIEYNRSLAAYRKAQMDYAAALREHNGELRTLGIDITDPVAEAQEALRRAQEATRAAQSPDAKASAQNDERRAQADLEAKMFNQKLSDVQIADQLGRISHAQYIQYLQNEHDRLSAINGRTRQQQDQLDQIDLALKAAADELSGQFNLGDIKIPTVYEVRRSIAAQNMGTVGGGVVDNSQTTLQINGADFGRVVEYINTVLGGPAQGSRAPGGRKVGA